MHVIAGGTVLRCTDILPELFRLLLLFALFFFSHHLLPLSPLCQTDDVSLPGGLAHHVRRRAHPHADPPEGQSGGSHPEAPRPAALLPQEDRSGDVLCHVVGRGCG